MLRPIECSAVVLGPLLLCWTLVDQGILPSGFERDDTAFGDHWEATTERDDEKSEGGSGSTLREEV